MRAPEADAAHWRRTRNLAVFVLVLWAVVAVGVFWAVLPLGGGADGVPAGYWYAAEAALILLAVLAFYQSWRQRGIDRRYGDED